MEEPVQADPFVRVLRFELALRQRFHNSEVLVPEEPQGRYEVGVKTDGHQMVDRESGEEGLAVSRVN
jgi:hypothetical protein